MKAIKEHTKTIGQALVEFALAGMLISLLLAASVDLGMIFFTVQGLHNAAQEGAMYGRRLDYIDQNDADNDNGGDPDDEDIVDSSAVEPFSDFVDEVRTRTSYEAGKSGGIGFISLRDLNNDGINDDQQSGVQENYIDVEVVKTLKGDEPCDPRNTLYDCYIRVTVRARYNILFPLAPAFTDHVVLSSQFTVPLDRGAPEGGEFTAIDEEDWTPTPTISSTAVTMTPTPTPTVTICADILDSNVGSSDWVEQHVRDALGKGSVNGTVELCTVSRQIRDNGNDQFYYVEKDTQDLIDEGETPEAIEFIARMTKWEQDEYRPDARAGLMIRGADSESNLDSSAPYALVTYKEGNYDNYIALEYRASYAGSWMIVNSDPVVDPPSDANPIWFRLVKEGNFISASYARGTGTPGDGDWIRFHDDGDPATNPWKYIEGLSTSSNTLFGLATASGHDAGPNPDGELYTTFDNITFVSLADLDASFVNPLHPSENAGITEQLHEVGDTPFEIEVDSSSVDIQQTTYAIYDPLGTLVFQKTVTGDEPACIFGGSAGSCDPMDSGQYDALFLERGTYLITAFIEYEVGGETKERLISSEFIVDDIELDFLTPAISELQDGDLVSISSEAETAFEISAMDPKYSTVEGEGFSQIVYTIQKPGGETDEITRNGTDGSQLCMFGGTAGSCDTMSDGADSPYPYESLVDGVYMVTAEVTSLDGTTKDLSFKFEIAPVVINFIAPSPDDDSATNRVEMQNGVILDDPEHSTFEVEAYAPHVTGGAEINGEGIAEIRVVKISRVADGDGVAIDEEIVYSNATFSSMPYCLFGESGGSCNEFVTDDGGDYYDLASGEYLIHVQVRQEGGSNWVPTTPATRRFVVPKLPLYVDFVKNSNPDEIAPDNLGTYLQRDQELFDFRVKACKDDDGGSNCTDGDGVEQVEFELVGPDDTVMGPYTDDNDTPFCAFDDGGSCTFMDEDIYKDLLSGTYTVRARARETLDIGGAGRWSEWAERTFEVAPIEMEFVDPLPTPVDDDNDDYDDDDRKRLDDLDKTRFQIRAYDPRFCDTITKDNYDADNPDFDNCHGAGITQIDFKVYGPDDDDEEVDYLDGQAEAEAYTAGDPMCMFGEDTDDADEKCNTMDEDNFDGSGDDVLPRGEYVIQARVSNAASWTDWDTDRWIERLVFIPPVYLEFVTERIVNENQDAPFPFEVLAYDEKVAGDDPDPAEGIDYVRFEIFAPWDTEEEDPIYEFTDYTDTSVDPYPFCVFEHAGNAKRCNAMPNDFYRELVSGIYTVRAHAVTNDGFEAPAQDEYFQIAPQDVYIEVMNPERTDFLTVTEGISGTLDDTTFEAYASISDPDLELDNGNGIKRLQITVKAPNGLSVSYNDNNVPYCLFGGNSNCRRMDQKNQVSNIMPDPPYGTYTILIRARLSGENPWRWSDPKKIVFELVP